MEAMIVVRTVLETLPEAESGRLVLEDYRFFDSRISPNVSDAIKKTIMEQS